MKLLNHRAGFNQMMNYVGSGVRQQVQHPVHLGQARARNADGAASGGMRPEAFDNLAVVGGAPSLAGDASGLVALATSARSGAWVRCPGCPGVGQTFPPPSNPPLYARKSNRSLLLGVNSFARRMRPDLPPLPRRQPAGECEDTCGPCGVCTLTRRWDTPRWVGAAKCIDRLPRPQ